jgi:hypothetical protein
MDIRIKIARLFDDRPAVFLLDKDKGGYALLSGKFELGAFKM